MESFLSEIDHIGIAVRNMEAAVEFYAKAFGAAVVHREFVDGDGVEEALILVAQSYVQLITPTRDDSPVARFLANRGEGLHHIAFRVDCCTEALANVTSSGYQAIDSVPRPGSRGTTVAFIHPREAFGTLIELVQE